MIARSTWKQYRTPLTRKLTHGALEASNLSRVSLYQSSGIGGHSEKLGRAPSLSDVQEEWKMAQGSMVGI